MPANSDWPSELSGFTVSRSEPVARKKLSDVERLHTMELKDVNQQILMRPFVAGFFALLLATQNILVFKIVWWALQNGQLDKLQLVFSVLVSATLLETYKVSQIIVKSLFKPIDYKDKHGRFKDS